MDWCLRIHRQQRMPAARADAAKGKHHGRMFASVANPEDLPIARLPYSPIIGPGRREMKPGTTYRCQRCGDELTISSSGLPPEVEQAARDLGISYETARRLRREIR